MHRFALLSKFHETSPGSVSVRCRHAKVAAKRNSSQPDENCKEQTVSSPFPAGFRSQISSRTSSGSATTAWLRGAPLAAHLTARRSMDRSGSKEKSRVQDGYIRLRGF